MWGHGTVATQKCKTSTVPPVIFKDFNLIFLIFTCWQFIY